MQAGRWEDNPHRPARWFHWKCRIYFTFKPQSMAGSPHILIIESESLISWHLALLLQSWGYVVTEWRDREPLFSSSSRSGPSLILLNPGLAQKWIQDGLLETFMLTWSGPVLLLSSTTTSEGWLSCIPGASLSKPFTGYQLRKSVEETLARNTAG